MLTPKQKQVLDFVNVYNRKFGLSPSLKEIGKKLKVSSSATVHQHIEALKEKGYLNKQKNQKRGIEIPKKEKLVYIPLLGTISAGKPIEPIEYKEPIRITQNQLSLYGGNVFALKVSGNSMIEENINDGDIILVKPQNNAENGQKVIALVDNQATLKTFYKEEDKVILRPANKNLKPIKVSKNQELRIQGIVMNILKNIENKPSNLENESIKKVPRKSWGNDQLEFYLGDCLKILQQINKKYTVIYLDPPFNTNRNYKYAASQKDFTFSDTWREDQYEKWLDDLIGLAKKRLEKNGTLFFHISAELSFIPYKILSKYFNKVEPIFWKKAHGKNTVKNKLGAVIDIIYKASENGSKFNILYVPLNAKYFENSYTNKDEFGYYALGSIKHDKTRRGYFYSINKNGITYKTPYGWKIPKDKLEELIRKNRIHYSNPRNGSPHGMLYKKLYKHECKGKPLSNLWDDISYITRTKKDERFYPTQKPLNLLKRIIEMASDKNDWVLDPVAGSGTTGIAALLLNRNVTLIDNNKEAEKAIKLRLQKILKENSNSVEKKNYLNFYQQLSV